MIRIFAASILTIAFISVASAKSDDAWTVSCSRNGHVVYADQIGADAVNAKRQEVDRDLPGATCVFLSPTDTTLSSAPQESIEGDEIPLVEGPSPLLVVPPGGKKGVPVTGAPGLDQALRALHGGKFMPKDEVSRTSPAIISPPVRIGSSHSHRPDSADWVRLTEYRGGDESDAIADWKRIISLDPDVFGSLTAKISFEDDTIFLDVGPIAPDERAEICIAAQSIEEGCDFGYEENLDSQSVSMRDFLSMARPEEDAPSSPRKTAMEIEASRNEVTASERMCWVSWYARFRDTNLWLGANPSTESVTTAKSEAMMTTSIPTKIVNFETSEKLKRRTTEGRNSRSDAATR